MSLSSEKPTARVRLYLALPVVLTLLAHGLQGWSIALTMALISTACFIGMHWAQQNSNPQPPQKPILKWRISWPAIVGGLVIGFLAWEYKTIFGRQAGVAALMVLASFKLWECRKPRDTHILVGLLFFLQLAVFLSQESILSLASVLVCATFTLSAWVFSQNQGGMPWQAPLKETLRLAALGLPLAIVLFFVFPRIAGPLWGLPQDASTSRLGLSNTLEPGRFAQLAGSDALALRAKFEGVKPDEKALYWRGPVLSQFDGLVWRPALRQTTMVVQPQTLALPENLRYTLTAEPHKLSLRVLLDLPLQASNGIVLNNQGSPSGEVMLERETVTAISHPNLSWGNSNRPPSLSSQLTTQQRSAMLTELELPVDTNPQSRAFAAQLRQNQGGNQADTNELIQAVLAFYRERFRYTLDPPKPTGRLVDSIDGFLFQTQAGYCEHFAASFVVLMRAMGIPARIVTGYQGGEYNPQDGWITVMQNDAHAWAEIFHPQQGWLRIDPTAAVAPWRIEAGGASLQATAGLAQKGLNAMAQATREALAPLRLWAQATVRAWEDYGLNYGKERQKNLFKTFGFEGVDSHSVGILLGGLFLVWLSTMALLHRNKLASLSAHRKALAQFDRFCKKHKEPRPSAQTPLQWAALHSKHLPAKHQKALQAWLSAYEAQFYKNVRRFKPLPKL